MIDCVLPYVQFENVEDALICQIRGHCYVIKAVYDKSVHVS